MSLFEVLEDLIDPDKAGDGVRRLGEALGTFAETMESLRTLRFLEKLDLVSRGKENT